jgi:hypothetical protein
MAGLGRSSNGVAQFILRLAYVTEIMSPWGDAVAEGAQAATS